MRKLLLLGGAGLLFLGGCDELPDRKGEENHYHLIFEGINDRSVQVEAEIEVGTNELQVHPDEIWYLPGFLPETGSWWQLINIETIEDMDGNPLTLGEKKSNRLVVKGAGTGRIRILYSVDISYVDKDLPYGTSAAGSAFPKGYFSVAKPLFITGDQFLGAQITIEKPASLQFDAPWKMNERGYFAPTYDALTLAAFSVGAYEVLGNQVGGLDYRLIAFGLEPEVKANINGTMAKISDYYLTHYPLSSSSRYIQFAYPERYLGGEAYPASSVSGIVPEKIDEGGWKLTMAHELFHIWLPFLLPGAEREEMEWFKEGFTNYLSERALVEIGEIEEETWKNHAVAKYNNYLETLMAAPENITIATSGIDKDEYGALVYDGGRGIAAWLDRELMSASSGEADLKALISQLITHAGTQETTLDVQSFLANVAAIDASVAESLEIYLRTKTPVPLVIDTEE